MPLGSEEAQAETSIWTFGAGGSWGDATTLTIDTPQNLEGLQAMRQLIDTKATQPDPGGDRPHPADQRVHPGQAGHGRGPAADRRPDQGEEPRADLRHRADPDQGRHAGHPRRRRPPDGLPEQRRQGRGDQEVRRLLLLEAGLRRLGRGRGLPAGDQVRGRRAVVQAGAEDLPGRAADGQVLPGGEREVVGHPGCAAVAGRPDRAGQPTRLPCCSRSRRPPRPADRARSGSDPHRTAARRRPPRCWPPRRGWAGCCC